MTITIDASTPAPSTTASTVSTLTSASFTPPANSLVVIATASAANTNVGNNLASVSDGTNTYTLLAWAAQATSVNAALSCHYYASSPGAITVTATFNFAPAQGIDLVPIVLTGVAAIQNGAVATDGAGAQEGSGATPSVTVNATAVGSMIIAAHANFTSGTSPTPSGDQSITFNAHSSFFTTSGNGNWAQYEPTLTTAPGNVTISDTAPTGLTLAMCAAEILAGAGADPAVLRTLSSPRLV